MTAAKRLRPILAGFAVGMAAATGAWAADAPKAPNVPPPAALKQQWGMLDQYCVKCHNFTDWAGKIAFDTLTPDQVPDNQKIFETAIRKLHGGLMPPPGNPKPPEKLRQSFAAALADYLDQVSDAEGPQPGYVSLHRLNRDEYANAVRDLLGVTIKPAAWLPADTESGGFDNIADVLKISPTFLNQYLGAAREISIRAVGNAPFGPERALYVAPTQDQALHIDGLPLGTRGGMVVKHYFPADGDYTFNISGRMLVGGRYVYGVQQLQKVILLIDDRKVFEQAIGTKDDLKGVFENQTQALQEIRKRFQNIQAHVTAGVHRVGVTFIAGSMADSDYTLEPIDRTRFDAGGETGGHDKLSSVENVEILGPYHPTGQTETESQQKIFICRPQTAEEELPCAKKIFANIARRAYRRPVTDEDMQTLVKFYQSGHDQGGFKTGVQRGIMAILATPKFLYRGVIAPKEAAPGSIYHLTDLELASRLSFFLWSSVPDNELIDVALKNKLHEPKVLRREVERMLADPRSKSLVTNFAFQWLELNKLDTLEARDPDRYPDYDEGLVDDFREEVKLFIDSVLRGDRNVTDLLTANYTFLNERLADFYGISGVNGDKFRRVTLDDPHRWGILGKGAVLIITSYPNRTSPVLRGQWLLANILGAPPEAPPAGVNTNLDQDPEKAITTVRERLAAHRTEKSCNMCHGVIDPLGLALGNFNAIGQWRTIDRYTQTPIDARGELATGQKVASPGDIRDALMMHPNQFVGTFTEKLLTYALGRITTYADMPEVRRIVDAAKKDDYRFSSIVMGIVTSAPFQMERVPSDKKDASPTQEAGLAQ